MDNFKLLLWLSLLFWITEASVQKFEIEPQDQTAQVNSRIILPCRVTNKLGILQWTKDDFGLGVDRSLSSWDRYSMIGNEARGDFYLQIYPVLLEDDGKYQCQVSPYTDYHDHEIRSNFATLTVLVPPEPPRILQGSSLVTYEYMQTKLECVSYGGRPAPAISWFDNHGNRLTNGVNTTAQVLPDGKRFLIKSTLTIIPRMKDRNTTFTCRTRSAAEPMYQRAKVTLDVRYPPHVSLLILSNTSNGYIPEGTDVRLKCQAEANPSVVSYQWILNDKIIEGNFTTELTLKNVTREYHEARVKCKVYNEHGKSEEGEILYISSALQFRNKPQSVLADLGEVVTLCCDVVGSPYPEITWFFVNSSQIVGHDVNLTFRLNMNNAGRYKCIAHISGYPNIEAEASVFLKGIPYIKSPRTQFGVEGDTVRVECLAHSIPAPTAIVWTTNDSEVRGEEYSILEEPLPDGIKSTLVIRKSEERHFGLYSCKVTNSYGSDLLEINLKTEETFSFMVIVNIAVTVVLIFAGFVIVIAFYWYRRYKRRALVNVDINIIENQLRQSNESVNTSTVSLELKMNCTRSNEAKSESANKSVSQKSGNLPVPHGLNKNDRTYVAVDKSELDNWPPARNPNYVKLQDPPLLLGELATMNFFQSPGLSTSTPGDMPNVAVVEMDPRFQDNSDLNNLKLGLPIRKKPKVPARLPPSPYVQVGYFKNRGLETIYE